MALKLDPSLHEILQFLGVARFEQVRVPELLRGVHSAVMQAREHSRFPTPYPKTLNYGH